MMRMRLPDILFKPLQPLINLVIGFIDVSPPLGEDVRVMVVEAELLHDCRHDQRQMAGHVDLAVQEDVMLREHILDVCARDIQVSEDVVLVVLLQGYPLGVLDVVHPQLLLDAVHLMGLPVHDAHHAVDPQITHHPLVFERLHIAQEQAPPQKMLLLGLVIEAQDVTAILLIVFLHYLHCIIYNKEPNKIYLSSSLSYYNKSNHHGLYFVLDSFSYLSRFTSYQYSLFFLLSS